MASSSKATLRGRDSKTGHFVKVEEARRRPDTTQVERVPKPGYGVSDRKNSGSHK